MGSLYNHSHVRSHHSLNCLRPTARCALARTRSRSLPESWERGASLNRMRQFPTISAHGMVLRFDHEIERRFVWFEDEWKMGLDLIECLGNVWKFRSSLKQGKKRSQRQRICEEGEKAREHWDLRVVRALKKSKILLSVSHGFSFATRPDTR